MSKRCSRSVSALLLGLAVLGAPGLGQASGFQIRENSAQALGRAFAGSVVAPGDLSVAANNPAALSLMQGTALQVDVSWIDLGVDFDGAGADALGRPLSGGDGSDAGGLFGVPALYFAHALGDDWRMGVSLSAPFGLGTDYDAEWVGRYEATHCELKTLDVGLSFAWQVSDNIAIGASLIHQSLAAEISQAIDFGGLLAASPALPPGLFEPQSADGGSTLDGDDRGWGGSLGVLWRLASGTRIGLSYRSEIEHTLRGDVDYDVPASVAAVLAAGGVTRFEDTRGRVDLTTPSVTTLSLQHALSDRLALLADVSLTDWSVFDELRVRSANGVPDNVDTQDWRDTWFGALGAEYRLGETLLVRGGVGYDQAPTRLEHRSPRVPDTARRWLSVGMSWQASESAVVHVGYSHLFTDPAAIASLSASNSTLEGEVDTRADVLAVSLSYAF